MAPPVFKTGLAGNTLAGRFDSFPPPPRTFDAGVPWSEWLECLSVNGSLICAAANLLQARHLPMEPARRLLQDDTR